MTAKELREALAKLPDDTPVLVAHQSRNYDNDVILSEVHVDVGSTPETKGSLRAYVKPNSELKLVRRNHPDGKAINAVVIRPEGCPTY